MCWFVVLATVWENSGECWFSRPSELVSPERDYHRLAQDFPLELSPERLVFVLSDECSRLGEKGLARVIPRRVPCPFVGPSPRRDGVRLSERVPLAWASPVSLSEAEGSFWCCYWVVHRCVACLSDPNTLLEGLRDDSMIDMLHLKWK